MFKERLKGIIASVIAGVLLSAGVAYAISTTNLYDVINDGVTIVVDGKELHPTDVNGNEVQPFIYNGTTYLPVRAVAGAMNKAVAWDGETFTVYLGNMNGKLAYPTVELEKMTSIDEPPKPTSLLTDNYGKRYSRAIFNYVYNSDMEYLLNMKYSRFKGTLYIPEGRNGDGTVHLTIEADGKTIYTSPEMDKTSRPVDVDVSVKGCNDIKILFYGECWGNLHENIVCLADAGFYQ